ncbi:MAG: 1-deoxy-D-xylulose-5-phosphate synthase N-terminal domain-containing protein, partial [Oscillospiraceae bacterium]
MAEKYKILDGIIKPSDVKKLSIDELNQLSSEVREFLINSVSKTGGHLASNLGAVELTIALHKVFDSPNDKIVFDVGHQCYTHKLLTNRKKYFSTLRKKGGLSGFPKTRESKHDAFISGHSSTSISAALGIATAFKMQQKNNYAVAVIGDGAFTGGQVYEALNNAGRSKTQLIVVLNHNDMSISKSVGAFSKYLTTIRSRPSYLKLKNNVQLALNKTPVVGKPMQKWLESSKSLLKTMIYRSTFFEEMGFSYLGPTNGHNIQELVQTLSRAKEL